MTQSVGVVGKVDGFPSQLFFHHLSHFGRCANRDDFQLSVQRWNNDSSSVRISCQQIFRSTSTQLETYSSPSGVIRPFSANCRRVFEVFDDHVKQLFSVVAGVSLAIS